MIRLVHSGVGEPAWNMALDEAILESVSTNLSPPTLRLYQWDRWAVTLGRFQERFPTLESEIPFVRRITGGRGILHGDDLTISLVASTELLGISPSESKQVSAIYARLLPAYLLAFAECGVEAEIGAETYRTRKNQPGNCFATVSRADIVEKGTGRKLLGAAIHCRDHWFLQQASLPLYRAEHQEKRQEIARAIFYKEEEHTTLEPGFSFITNVLEATIVRGMSQTLGITIEKGEVTAQEMENASHLRAIRYENPLWNRFGTVLL